MRLCKLLYLLAVTTSFASCYSELGGDLPPIASEGQSLSISFESDRMLPQTVTTRISDPKTEEEKKINTLHIFFFGPGGEYLTGKYLEGYPQAGEQGGYCAPSQGATILKIDRSEGAFDKADSAKAATIVAVANVEEFTFSLEEGTRRPSNIKRLGDLERFLYKPQNGVALGLPDAGMPMFGISRGNDLTTTTTNALTIEMEALMARIDLHVKLDSEEGSTGGLPRMQLVEWSVKNLPVQMPFVQPANGALGENKKTIKSTSSQQITNRNGEMSLSFYMFENLQEKTGDYDYPDSVKVDEYQRYKPLIADTANATCVQLHTFYTTYNNYLYDATYTLYLGANHTDDFKVYRNRQYKNNITVKGITKVGNNPDHITLDARVNVTTDNPFFISILRERNHDAHFCITPMDVYMFEDTGEDDLVKMEVSIEDPENNDWIRMEKIPAVNMGNGTIPNEWNREKYIVASEYRDDTGNLAYTNPNWHAGNGKRKYFTTNLLTDVNELKNNTTMTLETHRDRIYFYIDENLTPGDRSVNIHFKYTGPDGSVKERDMLISQTHLLPITIEETYDGNETFPMLGGSRTKTIYMEVYEEYLEHYDPLDEYATNQIYSGLEWGVDNTRIKDVRGNEILFSLGSGIFKIDYKSDLACSHNWYQGLEYTNQIISDAGQGKMDLNSQPRSAAEYCYNRNKRDPDGSVADGNKKWFLPGIRQMERSLTKYYNQFPEFQGNFYWSSAAGEVENGSSGQSSVRARATKVNADGSYVNSGGGDGKGWEYYAYEFGNGGYAKRTKPLRIRAFRNDLLPIE